MLSGYWLLCDLDGTLISTPHKANGAYLPLDQSPCHKPLERWLLNGGSLCVVTTADQRVLRQMYMPLRDCLGLAKRRVAQYQKVHYKDGAAEGRPAPAGGKLLLSLYTGAALYTCSKSSIRMVGDYLRSLHCATEESVEQCRLHSIPMLQQPVKTYFFGSASSMDGTTVSDETEMRSCVRGTCIELNTAIRLHSLINTVYHRFLRYILEGKELVVAGLRKMSRRYKNMWKALLTFLDLAYTCSTSTDKKNENTYGPQLRAVLKKKANRAEEEAEDELVLYRRAGDSEATVDWKVNFLSSHGRLLVVLGIIRMEFLEREVTCSEDDDEDVEQAVVGMIEKELLTALERSTPAAKDLAHSFAAYIAALLGPDPKGVKTCFDPSPNGATDVAQIIVLGIPLSLFSLLFKTHLPDLVKGGVNAMPQPNSVVISKLGVSKSTALRYLLGKEHATTNFRRTDNTPYAPPSLLGCVEVGHAAAFGDNPHSTDFELTVFDDVPFFSVEKDSQRAARHAHIRTRLTEAEEREARGIVVRDKYGQPSLSVNQVVSRMYRSGPLMDDRLVPHIVHIGGEEGGSAVYLNALMNLLRVPTLSRLSYQPHVNHPPVTPEEFQRSMNAAATVAREAVVGSPLSKL
ncbi:hypothetical protein, conserved [Angomonas deanei]|uniref:Uncharacterized protein n=1 Tax=Angomonas deanei TaxID=59799 RepID=A0A7G2C7N2_9TRYP|nr:hypothetical protein, conserved [Angomonas deanei]